MNAITSAGAAKASDSKQGKERSPVRRASRRVAIRSPEGWAYS
ncbi:hypothetical protein OG884_18060 [Streptosporangium sp. NBC_01755]|nr:MULTISPECIES: hypothetical protein [unclassified Streptosporangium]WSA24957.1 hypothetical protein OIE13_29105 [Streptosporangium sp. NBC_01810]WSD03711.1 hypothetical protein OG884_18060 [Streptosporangium sp. NBC_01755]